MKLDLLLKIHIVAALAAGLAFCQGANASDSFKTEISVSAKHLDPSEKMSHLCYQLAAQGEVLGEERVPTKWQESLIHKEYVYRVTRLSSGLVCKELIEGTNELQFGSGAQKEGCHCEGAIEILR